VDGATGHVATFANVTIDESSKSRMVCGLHFDITARCQGEKDLRTRSKAVEQSPIGVVITDSEGQIEYANPRFLALRKAAMCDSVERLDVMTEVAQSRESLQRMWALLRKGETWQGEIKRSEGGALSWERIAVSPVREPGGQISHYVTAVEDITEQVDRQQSQAQRQASLQRMHGTLARLAQSAQFTGDSLGAALAEVSEAASEGLNIERASIWFFDEERTLIRCVDLYQRFEKQHSLGMELLKSDFPVYFDIIETARVLAIADARNDPRSSAFAEPYLKPLGITSMLDVPIWLQGEVVGIVCHEHCGPLRNWTEDEQAFARSIADFAAIALEADQRREAQAAAESATRAKSMFLANMTHEIRTPINAVIGFTHLAMREQLPPKLLNYLGSIKASSLALLDTVNDILDFSKVEAGRMRLETVPFDLHSIMEGLLALSGAEARKRGLRLHFDVSPRLPATMVGDPVRLRQVLMNLLSNAIKFTESGSVTVEISLCEEEEATHKLRFAVRDTGMGISDDDLAHIFAAFEQADSSTTRRFGGTGLGLAISRDVVALMGGELCVESELGVGSTFSFVLDMPLPVPDAHEEAPSSLQQLRILQNLLSNSIKYSANGCVDIVIRPCPEGIHVSVSDTGPGVPEEFHTQIFRKFGQVEGQDRPQVHSVGLGLAYCKLAVEAHGGLSIFCVSCWSQTTPGPANSALRLRTRTRHCRPWLQWAPNMWARRSVSTPLISTDQPI
jgi:two-component system, sensor histidine kinase and response regulator